MIEIEARRQRFAAQSRQQLTARGQVAPVVPGEG